MLYEVITVLEEDDVPLQGRILGELGDLLDQVLAFGIRRMRLAGENDLHGPRRIQQDLLQPLGIGKQQRRALVRGEPTGEAVV